MDGNYMMPNWKKTLNTNKVLGRKNTHDDFVGWSIFDGELAPDGCILSIGGTSLANDGAIPPSVVVLVIDVCQYLVNNNFICQTPTRSMMTRAPVARAACTVASYSAKKLALIVPPRVGVMSCQARWYMAHSFKHMWKKSDKTPLTECWGEAIQIKQDWIEKLVGI